MKSDRLTLSQAREALTRIGQARKRLVEKNKKEFEQFAHRGVDQVIAIGTGATVGLMRGMWGNSVNGDVEIPGVPVDADLAGAVLLGLPSLIGLFGDASDITNKVSSALSAIVTAREVERLVRK
jgi:hypothetical protein